MCKWDGVSFKCSHVYVPFNPQHLTHVSHPRYTCWVNKWKCQWFQDPTFQIISKMTLLLRSLHIFSTQNLLVSVWGMCHIKCSMSLCLCLHHCLSPHLTILPKAPVHTLIRYSAVQGLPTSWNKANTVTSSLTGGRRHLLSWAFSIHDTFANWKKSDYNAV